MMVAKYVAAGLVALAMLTGSAAGASPAAGFYPPAKGHTGTVAGRGWSGGLPRMTAPHVGDTETRPRDQPGGVCDHGDNAMIC
ncbi:MULTISPECIES: hypothetical protein [Bradyrhizobium]|jgi:hypothetical protein|uniref:hypothetical protein n=1 Tax=Bradyrhizobium TaxID=374 RepID=UPI000424800F|nr:MULTISPECIES: hypothetical protein [Bradyrhizobium]AUC96766.1 hypothetical protein CWS35_22850 [Bradyrhizobium sp. SK17]KIU46013.1 hypothetical protein QU41_24595 [Bradyrhizobium elkanii]MBK5655419.1 hypothetical protein [Rhizobium sp.]OCX26950.1 hypothetical protein QU42_29840 [Bradyrhizobium sp. UASWS1016]